MRVPLSVRLKRPDGPSLDLTRQATNLVTQTVSPGGFALVAFDLKRAIDAEQLAQFSEVMVYDDETGEQCGGGRLLEQDPGIDGGGQVWKITALGMGLAAMQDREEPYFLVDRSHEQWTVIDRNRKAMDASSGTAPTGSNENEALVMQHNDGAVSAFSGLVMAHRGPALCDMLLGGFSTRFDSGQSSGDWRTKMRAYSTGYVSNESCRDDAWSTTMSDRRYVTSAATAPATPDTGRFDGTTRTVAALHWLYVGLGGATANDNTWSGAYYPSVMAQRLTRFGNPVYGSAYETTFIGAQDAFIDVVRRYAPQLDIANATITNGAAELSQLAWYGGITPLGVMEDVLAQEQALTWHAWERQPNGLYFTELVPLDERVRYEATVLDGYSGPQPTSEVYDRVTVLGKTEQDRDNSARFKEAVPELAAAGVVRSKTVDLGSEVWSSSATERVGKKFLAEHQRPPSAGTLTIGRVVRDNFTGRYVPPWRIRAGELIRYRGVRSLPDTLNTSGPNGVTVSRIVSTEFSEATGQAVLELDAYRLDERTALTKLMNARTRRQ